MRVEIPLVGGTANRGRVHRVGDTVRRPLRPTTPAVHALLRHLEHVGFDGAPRVLGFDDDGREVLTYIPGQAVTAPAPLWGLTDAALRSVGRLLRRFHDAVRDFDPTPFTWSQAPSPPFNGGGITHNDPNLDNVVFRQGVAVALIDFDLAAPGHPVWDVAGAARFWAPLRGDTDIADTRRRRQLDRLHILVEAYGLDPHNRKLVGDAIIGHHEWMFALVADGARNGIPGFAEYWTPETQQRAERTRLWLDNSTPRIEAALRRSD